MATEFRTQLKFWLLLCCLVLADCAKPIDSTTISQLKKGISTKQDAVALLGEPTRTKAEYNGKLVFIWVPRVIPYGLDKPLSQLQLTFGADGKLMDEKITYSEDPFSFDELTHPSGP